MSGITITRKFDNAELKVIVTDEELVEHISGMGIDERTVLIRKLFEKDISKSFLLGLLNNLIAKK